MKKKYKVEKPIVDEDKVPWNAFWIHILDTEAYPAPDLVVGIPFYSREGKVAAIRLAEKIAKLLNADIPRP